MKTIYLYIDGQQVDLDGDELLLMNYVQEELSNPTAVRNSYSRQITLKGTAANNSIFGNIYREDRRTDYSPGSSVGRSFNPLVRTPFEIYRETSEIVMSGYIRLDKVTCSGASISYTVNLYGGLGGFFYSLTYKDDGSALSLADMTYDGGLNDDDEPFGLYEKLKASDVADAWDVMSGKAVSTATPFWHIINFAPCYNGLPEDFDSDKMVVGRTSFANVPISVRQEGVTYGNKDGTLSYLVTMANKHTEWQVKDLRCYLQRPCVSMKAIIDAICDPRNNGGYTVELDPAFFMEENMYYTDGWITLPLIPKKNRLNRAALYWLLQETDTPAAYLLSFAKMFGLLFLFDDKERKVSIMSRNTFFSRGNVYDILDLTDMIDVSSVSIVPITPESKYYQFGKDEAIGEYASQYAEQYGRAYGIQKVNTGYEFDTSTNVLTDSVVFNAAPEVLEYNRLFARQKQSYGPLGGVEDYFIVPQFEECTVQLWGKSAGEEEQKSIDVTIPAPVGVAADYDSKYPYADFAPKVQLHDADNKAADGSGVFLIFDGMATIPGGSINGDSGYYLTNDTADMLALNQDVPCWTQERGKDTRAVASVPSFRRMIERKGVVVFSAEWGIPSELANPQIDKCNDSLYSDFWQEYIGDRFSADTKVMTCKANLSTLEVGPSLLRRICWYRGSYWVINKISNHSMTTEDLTEIELVKVNDRLNYQTGQRRLFNIPPKPIH
ncbi:MAG: hypothetical protein NC115_12135 [Bacteroidales bacterium]|nr:hypothetical protein [Bacteroidales bacterium]